MTPRLRGALVAGSLGVLALHLPRAADAARAGVAPYGPDREAATAALPADASAAPPAGVAEEERLSGARRLAAGLRSDP